MNSIAINTSQNVNIDFPIASIGNRMLAFVIDMLIKMAYLIVLFFILFRILNIDNYFSDLDNWSIMAFFGIITLPINLYTLAFESLMEGQTPGKRVAKIKVIKIDGFQAKFSDYFIRWIFRLVDIFISSGVVGALSVILSPNAQRLGGMASGTAVIDLRNRVKIDHTILEDLGNEYQPQYPQVMALSDNDMRLIKDNFRKANALRDYKVIEKLANKIREVSGIQRQEVPDKKFIEIIIKDFNYYTGRNKE